MVYKIYFLEKIEIELSEEILKREEMEIKPIDVYVFCDELKINYNFSIDLPNSKFELLWSEIFDVLRERYDLTQGDVFLVALDRKEMFKKSCSIDDS